MVECNRTDEEVITKKHNNGRHDNNNRKKKNETDDSNPKISPENQKGITSNNRNNPIPLQEERSH
jgi:hypothetical protein